MQRILVTLDGSPESEAVIPVAVELAKATGAEVHLLRAEQAHAAAGTTARLDPVLRAPIVEAGMPNYPPLPQPLETHGQALQRVESEVLNYLEGPAKAFEGLSVRRHAALDGDAAAEIIDLAKKLRVDLIAMSTHGRGLASSLVQGSVASKVVRAGVAPVLLVRPETLRA